MKKVTIAAIVSGLTLASTALIGAQSASAACATNHLCAYNDVSYGTIVIDTTYTGSGLLDAPDNVISSLKNLRSSGYYIACTWVTINTFTKVFTAQPSTSYSTLGSANDQIQHFYYNHNGC